MNTAGWEHRWEWRGSSQLAIQDLPKDVERDAQSIREQARQWQSQMDKQRNAAGYDKRGGPSGKGGNGGKSSGKVNGKNKHYDNPHGKRKRSVSRRR
jgi:hypothetical protein